MPRSLLVANPKSRRGEILRKEIETALLASGVEFIDAGFCPTPEEIGAAIDRQEVDRLIVAGGDGTVRCAAESLLKRRIPLGIIPTGTANNLARTLGIPLDVGEACSVIAQGDATPVDLARVNGFYFVSVAGIGLSTHVHRNVDSRLKRVLGPLAYAVEAIRSLRKNSGFRIEVRAGSDLLRGRAIQLTVCNGRHYGALMEVSNEATATDCKLDAIVISQGRWIRGLLNALTLRKEGPSMRRISGEWIEVRAHPRQLIDVEGQVVGSTPARFEIVPGAILVMVPKVSAKAEKDSAA